MSVKVIVNPKLSRQNSQRFVHLESGEKQITQCIALQCHCAQASALCQAPKEQVFLQHGMKSADFQQCESTKCRLLAIATEASDSSLFESQGRQPYYTLG